MEQKSYWFALKSHVYVEFKKNEILLYNTHTGNYLETELIGAITLISQMYEPENLGVAFLTKEILSDVGIRSFVLNVLEKQMGDLIDIERLPNKPVRLVPILNLQKDIDKLEKRGEDSILIGKDTKNYLLELNIFLNDICTLACSHCNEYYKQMHSCTSNDSKQELAIEEIENLFRQIQYSSIGKINILGGNIFKYQHIIKLQKVLESFKEIIHCYFHYRNYKANVLSDFLQIDLIVSFPFEENTFRDVWHRINKEKTIIHFIVEDESHYRVVEQLIEKYNVEKYDIKPFYTGENNTFFQENIFLEKEDIFFKRLSMREIFRNQKLNSNFFGLLFILPDGTVKANMNTQTIGNIRENSVLNLIYKEMLDNTAWRQIRNSAPCDSCIYQFICPPPSNYETLIGKPNLCHIK